MSFESESRLGEPDVYDLAYGQLVNVCLVAYWSSVLHV